MSGKPITGRRHSIRWGGNVAEKEGFNSLGAKYFTSSEASSAPKYSLRGFAWQWLMDPQYRKRGAKR